MRQRRECPVFFLALCLQRCASPRSTTSDDVFMGDEQRNTSESECLAVPSLYAKSFFSSLQLFSSTQCTLHACARVGPVCTPKWLHSATMCCYRVPLPCAILFVVLVLAVIFFPHFPAPLDFSNKLADYETQHSACLIPKLSLSQLVVFKPLPSPISSNTSAPSRALMALQLLS